ncbi:hypothetical protein HDU92_001939 [Lobulomyces angularis]|nr:hypothetical protein HDU92_001939 [Lobulomyces angularis]
MTALKKKRNYFSKETTEAPIEDFTPVDRKVSTVDIVIVIVIVAVVLLIFAIVFYHCTRLSSRLNSNVRSFSDDSFYSETGDSLGWNSEPNLNLNLQNDEKMFEQVEFQIEEHLKKNSNPTNTKKKKRNRKSVNTTSSNASKTSITKKIKNYSKNRNSLNMFQIQQEKLNIPSNFVAKSNTSESYSQFYNLNNNSEISLNPNKFETKNSVLTINEVNQQDEDHSDEGEYLPLGNEDFEFKTITVSQPAALIAGTRREPQGPRPISVDKKRFVRNSVYSTNSTTSANVAETDWTYRGEVWMPRVTEPEEVPDVSYQHANDAPKILLEEPCDTLNEMHTKSLSNESTGGNLKKIEDEVALKL